MVREDIFEGLKSGLARGKSLQGSMQSFYNSGYNKKEIEEAAKLLLSQKNMPQQHVPVVQPTQPILATPSKEIQKQETQMNKLMQSSQLVSYYGASPLPKKKSSGMGLIIFLIVFLVLLFGALIAVFLFKENIINFFQ